MHIAYIRGTGTQTGEFMGIPATNKTATWDEVHIGRMQDGKLAEHWAVLTSTRCCATSAWSGRPAADLPTPTRSCRVPP